jgi:ParB family transcriptional regulator, chromosome partitioning protein
VSEPKVGWNSTILVGTLQDIPISEIKDPHYNFREHLVVEELELSIEEFGLLHPILVTIEHDQIRIVSGYRRYNACKRLGWRKIPCHIIDVKDEKTEYELGLTENLQRRTLNPIEEARAFKKYVDELGWGGISELSKKVGRSPSYISRRISLLQLPKDMQLLISGTLLSASCGEELVTVRDGKQKSELQSLILRNGLSVRKIRELKSKQKFDFPDHVSYPTQNTLRPFDKSIITFKIAAKGLASIIEDLDERDWILREIFMQHRAMLRNQIDRLLSQRKKYQKNFRYLGGLPR